MNWYKIASRGDRKSYMVSYMDDNRKVVINKIFEAYFEDHAKMLARKFAPSLKDKNLVVEMVVTASTKMNKVAEDKKPYRLYRVSEFAEIPLSSLGIIYAHSESQARLMALKKYPQLSTYISSSGDRDVAARLDRAELEKMLREKEEDTRNRQINKSRENKKLKDMYDPDSKKAAWWVKEGF